MTVANMPSDGRSASLLCLLLLPLASCASKPMNQMVSIEDFCSDQRIMVEMQRQDPKLESIGQPWCKASKVTFRRDGEVVDIPVAEVLRGYAQSGDVLWAVSDSIIRLPEDRLVNLGPNAPVPIARTSALLTHLKAALGITASNPSAYQMHRFYAAFLEPTKRGYCVKYEMKPPFEGQLSQCSSLEKFSGAISYLPNVTTWQQAYSIACGLVEGSGPHCAVLNMSLVAGTQGQAFYLAEFQVSAPMDSRATYQRLYYVIDPMSGVAALRGQRLSSEPEIPLDVLLQGM